MAATQWTPEEDAPGGTDPARPWRAAPRGGTLLQSRDAPVFAALAAQWRSAGRMVPGQTDTEWAELVGRIPRLTRV
ncbi:hypothetical protein GA0115240_11142 [Streptomyces sp. DvalAA-14]|uniref:hypothetical protein n=1 Tax=unclassified Streptomyces TaxID=2593676 RepID=UPI00081B2C28|nr:MULTISPECIES: hypothetical protein [unclassified Streptomyces]MYS19646.1 hypothetical protein [Streptomyces sp. SID4948]SCD49727.1 hypothetical protein GA0115240_11142 [Streptomyces sp. DvalAA-14]